MNMTNVLTGIVAVIAIVGAMFGADARYIKTADLQQFKNEIINELRTEVTINRAVMIASMRRNVDDLEFQMMEYERKGEIAPRFIIEKHKQITRQIEDLQVVDHVKDTE